ncbi:MAG TPA: hypothetical protein PK020_13885 [Ilumatobacteraceae bacterium]|nr:hypothetical protein [Ilumatobacteraceae bacterium]HRB04753.1 hypothetical protein [Ilumatobacteraceae bacterium]
MARRTRILLYVSLSLALWFALTVRWATQPLSDAIPVGKYADGRVAVENVKCGTVFDSDAIGGNPVPEVVTPADVTSPWALPRTPCLLVHDQAQVLFGLNVVVFLLAAAAVGVVATRTRRPPIPQLATAAFH